MRFMVMVFQWGMSRRLRRIPVRRPRCSRFRQIEDGRDDLLRETIVAAVRGSL